MDKTQLDIMRDLVSLLNKASEAYYNTGTPIMTDKQFDVNLENLKQLEEETGFVFSNSPTHNVGAKVLTELKEIKHNHLMLSLEKCHTAEEVVKFANNKEMVVSIKLDGLTCSLTYENGILVSAETRGDGFIGSDITEHIKQFSNVPFKINKKGTYVIDGEAIITDYDFAEVNKNGEYRNSRNLASGTLAVLDTSLVAKRKLRFLAWDVIEGGHKNTLSGNLVEARDLGFNIVPFWINGTTAMALHPENLRSNMEYVFNVAKEDGLPCDGIVFKINDIEYGKSLGATSHHFKNGIAYKRKDDVYETKLVDIDWTLGKTGVLTPTAIFEPVEIDGSSISRASLANISVMKETLGHPYVGQIIGVSKRNAVIPKIEYGVKIDEQRNMGKN